MISKKFKPGEKITVYGDELGIVASPSDIANSGGVVKEVDAEMDTIGKELRVWYFTDCERYNGTRVINGVRLSDRAFRTPKNRVKKGWKSII